MASSRSKRVEYDRFILFRSAMDMDYACFALTTPSRPRRDGLIQSPSSVAYQKLLDECILKNRTRRIPKEPERVLDADGMLDEDGLNLLDWGSNNVLVIALDDTVCLWDDANKSAKVLLHAVEGSGPITSISWSPDSAVLAVALGNSVLALVDPATGHVTDEHENQTPVLSLAWRSNSILTVGSSDGTVVDYDFRKDDTSICFYNGHRRGVCSLKWSMLSGRYLASRGHDKLVHIWDACMPVSQRGHGHQWLHRISSHTSIVKALDWCPTRSNLLASGGGRHDHCIKFWNTVNGSCLNSIDAGSEVCALLWDKNKSELVTSHGFPKNQLTLWNYPSMTRAAELFAIEGSGPITSISWSPDSTVLAVAFGNSVLALVDPATGQDVNVTEDDENLTPVLSFAWRSNSILTVGSSDGTVVDYDFRKDDTSICFYNGHQRGVCSLKWSDNRPYLASGGHDKLVHIWDACMPVSHHHPRRHKWLHRISSHTSIVKALDWWPTRSNLLASGGGRNDQCIKFWNTVNGSCLNSIDAGSESCTETFGGIKVATHFHGGMTASAEGIEFTWLSMDILGPLQHRYTSGSKIGLEQWCKMEYNASSKIWICQPLQMLNYSDSGVVPVLVDNGSSLNPKVLIYDYFSLLELSC
ncbi:WD domain, G-beta repeat [Musa troglodytarum]|uniref:WD domain, G-beta repeat n=1 Tax=Musa troglodytarum TaxID=320322 RepID=A0A9E7JMR8_9LILI|nr:WD domain, G-beta repeat [Musa troglodytarum]